MKDMAVRLLNFTGDGVYRYDVEDGTILEANPGLARILDAPCPAEELCGKRIHELIRYTEKPGEIRRHLEAEGEIHGYEYHFQTLKGEDRWVLHDSFIQTDPGTGRRVVEAIVRDITPLKRAARAVERERAQLAVTLHSIGDGLIATDAEGAVTLLNPVAETMTGWPQDEAAGRPLAEVFRIVHEVTREPMDNPVQRVLKTGQTVALANHTLLLARGGRDRHIADSAAPIREADGTIAGVVLVFRDVTREKAMWNALRSSEARYRQLFEGMLDGFALHEIICDDQGVPCDYRFLEINPRFEEMTGLKVTNLLGRTVLEVMPATEPEWISTYGRVAQTGDPIHFERFSSALNRHYEVTAYRPAPGQFATVFVDVTARKKAEEDRKRLETQIQQTQKLESLGVLAGGIAHDFNNLLTGVLGNASLALLDVPDGAPAHDSLKQIERAAQRAADLCRQLLAYSGKGRFVVEPVDLSAIVEEMGNLLQLSISKKAILKYDLARHLPAVLADSTQLRQVVMNLIVNASEAIGERSGVIGVNTGAMTCDRTYLKSVFLNEPLEEGLYVFVEVSDSGCGMPPDTLARIFDPFFTTKFTGRGLGLSAILGIVRSHKGAVKVYSEPGRGSTFKILFPATGAGVAADPGDSAVKVDPRLAGTALVVDDDETIRSLARRALERAGMQVLTANDGQEAVALYRNHAAAIDVVLLDMTMPHMSGEEAYREIRLFRPDAVVVLSSGYTESDATGRFAGKGLAGFIQKPYRQSDLIAKLAGVLKESPGR